MAERIPDFQTFWPYYLGEHLDPRCRALHYAGTTLALLNLTALVVTGRPWFLLSTLVMSYGFAWAGHFFIEKNKPATFQYPFWSLAADFKMYLLFITGRLKPHLQQVVGA